MKLSTRCTGIAVLLVLTLASAMAGTVFSEISSRGGLPSADAAIKQSNSANAESINYSDCLWYVARNHGFYQVQKQVASDHGDTQNRQLWEQFVNTIGVDECGPVHFDMEMLTQAVAITVDQADQYFLSKR